MRDLRMRIKKSRWVYRRDLSFDPVPSNLIKEGGGIHAKVSAWKRLHRFGAASFTPTLLQFQCHSD